MPATKFDKDSIKNTIVGKIQRYNGLTIKEASGVIQGLSEYTVRMLVKQNKLSGVRTGLGKHGKILINKQELLEYFNSQS